MITIRLQGDPGMRTGVADILGTTYVLITWHRQAGGEVHATTDDGQPVTFAVDRDTGGGGITIGQTRWLVWDGRWRGTTFTGRACLAVSDAEMAGQFERWP